MPDKKLMRLMIECPNTYREVHLSDAQLALYKTVARCEELGATSEYISDCLDISVANARSRLRELWKKKYLRRVDGIHPTGGAHHTYYAAV